MSKITKKVLTYFMDGPQNTNQIKLPLISSCLENLLEISLQLRIFSGTYVTTKLEVVQSKDTIDLSFMFIDPTNRQYLRKLRIWGGGITNIRWSKKWNNTPARL